MIEQQVKEAIERAAIKAKLDIRSVVVNKNGPELEIYFMFATADRLIGIRHTRRYGPVQRRNPPPKDVAIRLVKMAQKQLARYP